MKRSRLSYDEWKCILSRQIQGKRVDTEIIRGYIGLLEINEVSEPQIWRFNGEDITVCDKGLKWLSILPERENYCITAMMNEKDEVLLWYIDVISGQGIDEDGVPYFDDLYLDFVVYPDGSIIEDDMDELEAALADNDITREQFQLAIETGERLRNGLLQDVGLFMEFTEKCREMVNPSKECDKRMQREDTR